MAPQETLPRARAGNEVNATQRATAPPRQLATLIVPTSPVAKTTNDLPVRLGIAGAPGTSSAGLSSPQGAPSSMLYETPGSSRSGRQEHAREFVVNEQTFESTPVGKEEHHSLAPETPQTAVMHFSALAAAMVGNYMTIEGGTLSAAGNTGRVTATDGVTSTEGVGNGVLYGRRMSSVRTFSRGEAPQEIATEKGLRAVRPGGPAAYSTVGKIENSKDEKIATEDEPMTTTSNGMPEESTSTSRRIPRAQTAEDFDFSFEYDYGGYKPSGGGSRAERLKARAARAGLLDGSGDIGVDNKADARKSKTDGGAFKPQHLGYKETCLKDFMAVVNKNRKERVAAGRANPPTKEELQQVHWIRCCECGKHRALPQGVTMDEMLEMYGLQHKKMWMCPRNTWDPEYATCAKPQILVTHTKEHIVNPLLGAAGAKRLGNGILRGERAGHKLSGSRGSDMPGLGIDLGLKNGVRTAASSRPWGTATKGKRGGGGGGADIGAYGGSRRDRMYAQGGRNPVASGGSINRLIQAMEPRKRHRGVNDSENAKTWAAPDSLGVGGERVAVGNDSDAGENPLGPRFKRNDDEGFQPAEPEPDESMLKAVDVLVVLRGVFG